MVYTLARRGTTWVVLNDDGLVVGRIFNCYSVERPYEVYVYPPHRKGHTVHSLEEGMQWVKDNQLKK